ncbi:MAG TPA: sigma-70 family RNA polymerase sigma factor [Candidatus Angelobacter sp.]|nr:sigma-70 family RNA polymerase sigma factor [Candidatus Angelobacter sp.]
MRPDAGMGALSGPDHPGTPRDIVQLYQAHAPRIYRYCLSQLGNSADAEDATQDAFMRAAPQLERLSGDAVAYLTAVAHNVCYDLRRSTRRRATPLEDVVKIDGNPGPDVQAMERALLSRAWKALNRQEKSLLAHTYAGFTYDEIAHRTGLSAKAVSVGICRARKRVRQAAAAVAALLGPGVLVRRFVRGLRRAAASNPGTATAAAAAMDQAGLIATSVVVGLIAVSSFSASPATARAERPLAVAAHVDGAVNLVDHTASGPSAGASAPASGHGPGGSPSDPSSPSPVLALGQPSAASPVGVVGHDAQPQSTYFDSMTVSPAYASDHTVFASGWVSVGCNAGQCPVLFVTRDGGASWSQTGKVGYQHGPVLLPPGYPADPTVFVESDSAGLLRSDDGGQTFRPVLPVSGVAAISPASTPGDARVLVVPTSGGQAVLYEQRSPAIAPGPTLPPQLVPTSVRFAGDANHIVVAGGLMQSPTAMPTPEVLSCTQLACTRALDLPGDHLPVALAGAPGAGAAVIVASSLEHMAVSSDGGQTFARPVMLSGTAAAASVGEGITGPVVLVATTVGAGPQVSSIISRSTDRGATLQSVLTNLPLGTAIHALLTLPDGRVLAGVVSADIGDQFGVRCSRDGGATWADRC